MREHVRGCKGLYCLAADGGYIGDTVMLPDSHVFELLEGGDGRGPTALALPQRTVQGTHELHAALQGDEGHHLGDWVG